MHWMSVSGDVAIHRWILISLSRRCLALVGGTHVTLNIPPPFHLLIDPASSAPRGHSHSFQETTRVCVTLGQQHMQDQVSPGLAAALHPN